MEERVNTIAIASGYYRLKAKKNQQKAELLERLWDMRIMGNITEEALERARLEVAGDLSVRDLRGVADTVEQFFPSGPSTSFILFWLREGWKSGNKRIV